MAERYPRPELKCGPLADDATARVLNTLLKGLLCWIFFNITLVAPLYAVHKAGSLAICIFAGLTFAAALVLLHRGLLRSASLLYLSGLWLPATITIVWNGGIHGVTMVFYITLPISAAWLLGYRAALISAAVCLCSALMMAVVEQNGVRLPRYIPGTPIATWTTILAAMIIAAVPVAQVLKILKEALAQSESAREAFREGSGAMIRKRRCHRTDPFHSAHARHRCLKRSLGSVLIGPFVLIGYLQHIQLSAHSGVLGRTQLRA